MADSGSITDTSEVSVKNITTESYSGTSDTQNEVNAEVAASLKEIIKMGVADLDTITSPERRLYYQIGNTTKRAAGVYWYNTNSTATDKWEGLSKQQLKFTFSNSKSWVLPHLLNRIPTIKCLDSEGNEIFGAISYPTANNAIIEFTENQTGIAYVN